MEILFLSTDKLPASSLFRLPVSFDCAEDKMSITNISTYITILIWRRLATIPNLQIVSYDEENRA